MELAADGIRGHPSAALVPASLREIVFPFHSHLARVYSLEDAQGKARAVLLELLKQYPDHPQAKKMLGEVP